MLAINTERNVRVNITFNKKMYNKLKLLAKADMRSTNSLVVYLVSQALQSEEWQDKVQALIDNGELQE